MPNPDKSLGRRYPSIHMPRSFSRAVLKLTNKPRLERVQDITEIDARAEGVAKGERCDAQCREPFRHGFIDIWHKLHTKPGERWQDNPEIVRLQFMRVA
jgi:hypothetical protein